MARFLVVDDDRMMCELLVKMGSRMGHEGAYALTLQEGMRKAAAAGFDVVFLDVNLPDGSGLDILPGIRKIPSAPEVIIITGAGDPDGAELAIRSGAWDYIQKPCSREAIRLPFVRALEYRKHKAAERRGNAAGTAVMSLMRKGIIGDSSTMRASLDLLAQAASSSANALITGETGTGKELFAWALHENSLRAGKPFVVVDCAALTESLVESVLFGHEKGSFTGADRPREGMIKQAHQGSLLLDEVGELPLSVQKAFLRVLQERRFRPVGGKEEVNSDFRLIAATNRDLVEMVEAGRFRKDLLYRIRSLTIHLPPLRERVEDIKDLALYHMTRHCERHSRGTKGLSPPFLRAIAEYDWPGNVRELVHAMETALIAAGTEPVLFPDHLPEHIRIQLARKKALQPPAAAAEPFLETSSPGRLPTMQRVRDAAIAEAEKGYLQRLMLQVETDIKEACEIAGLSRSQLYALLKKHGISRAS
ncbi:MAG: sigma-54-dependent transcriptional regulator [Syntrophobacteraceae bacterium]